MKGGLFIRREGGLCGGKLLCGQSAWLVKELQVKWFNCQGDTATAISKQQS